MCRLVYGKETHQKVADVQNSMNQIEILDINEAR
jgi:hypothetical protein